ncbi:hypothetical protein [Aeromicrobium wangtongii]|uniref:Uncharacterized protein n=1 Tax=Aeromicrobium wangtongii TaxID=2969247 RepID=A0ABY5M4Y1_9ACTN|nr:hypothetical protein [Aeromicrobium wangtongii]MCD9198074.1 hypothetical protein [Aeromicrobium wangtongii]UUP12114.1 hypothetical protein NQV15_09600 [Aeromicrobium wangtongii]
MARELCIPRVQAAEREARHAAPDVSNGYGDRLSSLQELGGVMRQSVRTAMVSAASLALVVGGAAGASADSGTVKDKSNDVVMRGKVSGDRTAAQKSFAKRTDVTSVKISHGSTYVSVTITFADLRAGDEKTARIDVARKSVTNSTGTVSSSFRLFGPVGEPQGLAQLHDSRGIERVCDTAAESHIKTTLRTGKNGFFKMQVPRSCLDNESKIKVRTTVLAVSGEGRSFKEFISPSKSKTSAWSEWILKG